MHKVYEIDFFHLIVYIQLEYYNQISDLGINKLSHKNDSYDNTLIAI